MDFNGHHEESFSPPHPMYYSVKTEPADFWNPQLFPVSNGMPDHISPLTLLTNYSPEPQYAQHVPTSNTYCSAPLCTSYSTQPSERENSGVIMEPIYNYSHEPRMQKDEGLGSSPGSSFKSTSPPSAVNGQLMLLTSMYDRPVETPPVEEISVPEMIENAECMRCGEPGTDSWWKNESGHYFCIRCRKFQPALINDFSNSTTPNPAAPVFSNSVMEANEPEMEPERKRKRSSVSKKENQVCSNCYTTITALWRRNGASEVVCNACGLYEKLHKRARPLSMKKDTIQTRKRKPRGNGTKKKVAIDVVKIEHPNSSLTASSYPMPTYNSAHIKNEDMDIQQNHNGVILPPMNSPSSPLYYKSEMNYPYHMMPSNVINVSLTCNQR